MKIDYTKDFTKYCGSKEQAIRIASKVAQLDRDKLTRWTVIKSGRYIKGAEGTQKNFKWNYSGFDKEMSVHFTDGRPQTEKTPANTYYIIHIEGFNYKTGDKIKSFDNDGNIIYTHKMTDSMRIAEEDIPKMRDKLRRIQQAQRDIDMLEKKKGNRTPQEETRYRSLLQVVAKNRGFMKQMGIAV